MSKVVQFNFPAVIRFGTGAVRELSGHLKDQGKMRPLVVTDPIVATLPFFLEIVDDLKKAGLTPTVYAEMHKNPVKSDVLNGKAAFAGSDCDSIVGIGGGVGLDVARAIALAINHHRDLFDYDDLIGGDQYVTEEVPYFVTVPTTSGTGSEVGRSAIIADDETHQKKILFSPKLLASRVFADPSLTFGLPPFVTAATGMDALTHNMEAYVAKNYHPMCDGIALEGIKLVAKSIEKATHDGQDEQARADMMLASLMGAVAFQKGLGAIHSITHPVNSLYHTHHGTTNGTVMPFVLNYNRSVIEDKFVRLANFLDIKGGFDGIVQWVIDIKKEMEIPETLKDMGVQPGDEVKLAPLAQEDPSTGGNPLEMTEEKFQELIANCISGKY